MDMTWDVSGRHWQLPRVWRRVFSSVDTLFTPRLVLTNIAPHSPQEEVKEVIEEVEEVVVEEAEMEETPKTDDVEVKNEESGEDDSAGRRYAPYKTTGDSDDADEESQSRRVYVGNLSWGVSWQDLKDHFKSCEEVTRADVLTGPDGRSKGCGIVVFATLAGAQKAVLTMNDTELDGRQIQVREDRVKEGPNHHRAGSHFSSGEKSQNRRVYVGNLSWDVAWQDLKDHCREAGEVVHAEVITEASGRSKDAVLSNTPLKKRLRRLSRLSQIRN